MSGKRHYLRETVPAGPQAEKEAEKVRIRLVNEVNERRNPRTSATVNQMCGTTSSGVSRAAACC